MYVKQATVEQRYYVNTSTGEMEEVTIVLMKGLYIIQFDDGSVDTNNYLDIDRSEYHKTKAKAARKALFFAKEDVKRYKIWLARAEEQVAKVTDIVLRYPDG